MLPSVVVRRTSQSPTASRMLAERGSRAWVVARRIHNGGVRKSEVADNIALARDVAVVARKSGQTCIVCPAIASDAKCGQCTACANRAVDIVLYPFHP